MKKSILLLLGMTASAIPFAASAEEKQGFYISIESGLAMPDDATYSGTGINTDAQYEAGGNLGTALGYRYGNGVRTEFEIDSNMNDLDNLNNAGATGDVSSVGFMVNAYYDYVNPTQFTPYIGVGGGLLHFSANDVAPLGGVVADDSDNTWGIQGILGASYAVNPWLDLFTQYKYVHGDDPRISNASGTPIDVEYSNNVIQVGVRVGLSPDAYAAEPAPAEKPAKQPYVSSFEKKAADPSYLVFFDFDKSVLSAEAKEILKKASAELKQKEIVQLEVTGHADRAGSEKYNQGLSERRAQAVKHELVKLGMKEKDIVTRAKGESQPLVATPDGVREPQNRRVEILYTPEN
jgi:OmpA-OmpF porin, OOP family